MGKVELEIAQWYHDECNRVEGNVQEGKLIPLLLELERNWSESWLEEFACDLIATYLTGAAYAWTNLKLTSIASTLGQTYNAPDHHPSDEARMCAILFMLEVLELHEEVEILRNSWLSFLPLIPKTIPGDYRYFFHEPLLRSLAEHIMAGCQSIGLASYTEQLSAGRKPVSAWLNEAWEQVRKDPEGYEAWEQAVVNEV